MEASSKSKLVWADDSIPKLDSRVDFSDEIAIIAREMFAPWVSKVSLDFVLN